MTESIKPIKNKYDIFNVEFTINEFFNQLVSRDFKTEKSTKTELILMAIRIVLSVVILLSYFHKTPFPLDKPLIFGCMILYVVLNWVVSFIQKKFVQHYHSDFPLTKENFPSRVNDLAKKITEVNPVLRLGSKVELYTSDYKLILALGDKSVEHDIKYENYIDVEGNLATEKLEKLFYEQFVKVFVK